MISAAEARRQTELAVNSVELEAKKAIDSTVKIAILKGETTAWIYGSPAFLQAAEKLAKEAGYKVTYNSCQRDGDSVKLDWS